MWQILSVFYQLVIYGTRLYNPTSSCNFAAILIEIPIEYEEQIRGQARYGTYATAGFQNGASGGSGPICQLTLNSYQFDGLI